MQQRHSVVDSVLTDIVKISTHDIDIWGDSLNFAVVRKCSELTVSQYEIRCFCFDFSSKSCRLTIPELGKISKPHDAINRAFRLLDRILFYIVSYEFGDRYFFGPEEKKLKGLKDRLVEKYSKDITARMSESSLQTASAF
jgi:hypothetical protein